MWTLIELEMYEEAKGVYNQAQRKNIFSAAFNEIRSKLQKFDGVIISNNNPSLDPSNSELQSFLDFFKNGDYNKALIEVKKLLLRFQLSNCLQLHRTCKPAFELPK